MIGTQEKASFTKWDEYRQNFGFCIKHLMDVLKVQGFPLDSIELKPEQKVLPPTKEAVKIFAIMTGEMIESKRFEVVDYAYDFLKGNWSVRYRVRYKPNTKLEYDIVIIGGDQIFMTVSPVKKSAS